MARSLWLTVAAVTALGAAVVWAAYGLAGVIPSRDDVTRDGVRQVTIHAHAWGFSPNVIRVAPGERMQFIVRSEDLQHGFSINELGINLPLAPGRDMRSPVVKVELPEGIYPIHCSVFCGIGHPSMKARLVVGDPPPAPSSRLPWIASLLSAGAAVGFGAWARAGRRARA
jgi:heme/copper-type cytochrome/quinol oxidase subunit 2